MMRQRTKADRWWRVAIVILAVTAAGVSFALVAFFRPPALERGPLPGPGSPREQVSPSPEEDIYSNVVIYYIGRSKTSLYREVRDVAAQGSAAETAVAALLGLAPLDPDYVSMWAPASRVQVRSDGDLITVDLPGSAFSTIQTKEQAKLAVQTLVYTVTDALHTEVAGVRLLRDSRPDLPAVFPVQGVFHRSGLEPMASVWVTSLDNGAVVTDGSVVFRGTSQPGVQQLRVRVQELSNGTEVASAPATVIGREGLWNLWEATVVLGPGNYKILAQGDGSVVDTKVLRVAAIGE